MALKGPTGKYYTRQLFWEEWINLQNADKIQPPMFTLYKDKPDLINFGAKYVELEDPTGYKVAQELLGEYRHWTILMNCKWFVEAKKLWDEELDAKLQSNALRKIQELMDSGLPAQQLAAAKYLANREHRKDHTASKGRPNKSQVEQAAREEAAARADLEEDYKRIRLVK